jgi:hypothetical protein
MSCLVEWWGRVYKTGYPEMLRPQEFVFAAKSAVRPSGVFDNDGDVPRVSRSH